jgi:hypothetical protein
VEKKNPRRVGLKKESLRQLTPLDLQKVAGAERPAATVYCADVG